MSSRTACLSLHFETNENLPCRLDSLVRTLSHRFATGPAEGRATAPDYWEEVRRITAQLTEQCAPEPIILFGSAARGELQADSDADFLIIKRDCPSHGVDRIRELHRLIERNNSADFLVYRPDEFESRLAMGGLFLKATLFRDVRGLAECGNGHGNRRHRGRCVRGFRGIG